jgi:hypothetical protein
MRSVLVGIVLLATSAVARPGSAAAPTAAATRIEGGLRLDGRLDEPEWTNAQPLGPLVQTEPSEGAPASEATEVRVLYDEDNLYFGILCRDRMPAAVVNTQLGRDADLDVDDRVIVVLDPFFDRRNGFFFEVNPAGARADGQVSNNAEHASYDWDGIWDAAARRNESGWAAEIAIPFKTLRFRAGQTAWGLNVERSIKRLEETSRWAAPRRDVWITNLAEAGTLTGLAGVRQGRGLDIRPYASGGAEDGEGEWKAGLDVVKNITPNLTASASFNTDFAETEVDARQINLTRFPLFFPEKRAFFLEGAGVFELAGLGGRNQDLLPFFSRRIGLASGQAVPLLAGLKLVGRQSGFNVGLLDVQTRKSERLGLSERNLLAARVSRNLFTQSWIGLIATRGNPTRPGENSLVGADARFATSSFRGRRNLSLDLYLFRSDDGASGQVDHAFGGKLDYPNDLWDVALTFKQIGRDFQPALGFVPRRGIRKTNLGVQFMPRPRRLGVRQLSFELRPEYITDLDGRVEQWEIDITPLGVRTDSGDQFEVDYAPQFERLPASFEIEDGVVVPAGSYTTHRYGFGFETASKRPWVVEASASWGGFYDGSLRELEIDLELKPSTHLALEAGFERNQVELPQGTFTTHTLSFRLDYNFSPNVSWANLVQYDNDSRILGIQSRFRLILRPGNDLFVVLNRGWERRERDGAYLPSFDKGSLKLQYTFRL